MRLTLKQTALFNRIVARAKRRIIADVKAGVVPRTVRDFGILHDYVDANVYFLDAKGNFDPGVEDLAVELPSGYVDNGAMWEFLGETQERVHRWLKAGALRDVKGGLTVAQVKRQRAARGR